MVRFARPSRRAPAVRALLVAAVLLTGCTKGQSSAVSTEAAPPTSLPPTTTTNVVRNRRVTIVLVVPTSGPDAVLGEEARAGLDLAFRHGIEDGRLPGDTSMNIRVLDESAKGLPRAVDRVVRDEKVIAMVGGLSENTEGVLAPIARRRKVALFSFTWRVGSEPADAVRVGPDPNALISVAAAAVKAAATASTANTATTAATATTDNAVSPVRPFSAALVVAAVPPTGSAANLRDQLVGTLNNPDVGATPFLALETSVPSDPSVAAQAPIVLIGSGQPLADEYVRIRPTPELGPASFVVPIDAEGCGARPTRFAPGARCISRGVWLSSATFAQAFREDAAAAGLVPSWATTVAYDAGGLLAALLGPSTAATPVAQMRGRLLGAGSLPALSRFRGINGKLIPGRGYEDDAQALIARDGEWRAEPIPR